jgi:hypothetical protein
MSEYLLRVSCAQCLPCAGAARAVEVTQAWIATAMRLGNRYAQDYFAGKVETNERLRSIQVLSAAAAL